MLNDYVLNIVMAGTIHVAAHEALLTPLVNQLGYLKKFELHGSY